MSHIDLNSQEQWDVFFDEFKNDVSSDELSNSQKTFLIKEITFNFDLEIVLPHGLQLLRFVDCQFKRIITKSSRKTDFEKRVLNFVNCFIDSWETNGLDDVTEIRFLNCSFFKSIRIDGPVSELHIRYNLKAKGQRIDKIELGGNFIQNVFLSNIEIGDLRIGKSVINLFTSNVLCKFFRCENTSSDANVIISKQSHFQTLFLIQCACELEIRNSKVEKTLVVNLDDSISEKFRFNGSEFGSIEFLDKIKIKKLLISNCRFGNLAFGEITIQTISISDSQINHLILPIRMMKFDFLSISGLGGASMHINKLSMLNGTFQSGVDKDKSSIIFESFTISSLNFISFQNNASFSISDINYHKYIDSLHYQLPSPDYFKILNRNKISLNQIYGYRPIFRIINSDLGKINFISCNFSELKMDLKASKIVDVFLAGTEMPQQLVGNFRERQVGYGQLKKIYESRGDSVTSGVYLFHELNSHYQSLKKRNIATGKRSWNEQWDYFTLYINKRSNHFGTHWGVALFYLLGLMINIFIYHNLSLGYRFELRPNILHLNNFFEILALFPEFLFPIHKADFIPEAVGMPITNWSRFWDFTGRIVGGYLIYQFIQAFRKYGKK